MTPIEPMTLSADEAAKYLGIGTAKLKTLELHGLAKLPGLNRYSLTQLQSYVQFLTNEQAKGWTLPVSKTGERENDIRVFQSEPSRSKRRTGAKDSSNGVHPLERRIDAA